MNNTIKRNALFNPNGDTDLRLRRMIGGNSTNLNDFNNVKYAWTSDWYRQAMNNFWIPEEINLSQDIKDYPHLEPAERKAYDKILSFLVFLDSLQSNNLPCVEERNAILYQWKTDEHLLRRNTFIGDCYNEFHDNPNKRSFMKALIANFILEGIYFYSGFMFFYNLSRNGKMPGSAQEIRYINRDENTHLWLFRNIIRELEKEEPEMFTPDQVELYKQMMLEGVRQEIAWGQYVIGDNVQGLSSKMVSDYIRYLGNLRWHSLGFGYLFEDNRKEPDNMQWVGFYSNANMVKTDFFEAKSTAYAKSSTIVDDL